MNLIFKNMRISNFMSFSEADVDLDNNGFVIVSGTNNNINDNAKSNGSGKSTIFEALCWCLTGTTIRGIKDVVNLYGDDGAVVELLFNVDNREYRLIRSKDHSELKTNLKIYINGEDKSGKSIRDTSKLLSRYLPDLTSSLIGSVVVLGQGLPGRFTNNSPSGRKELLEIMTKSNFMVDDLKDRLNYRLEALNIQKRHREDADIKLNTTIESYKNQLDNYKQQLDSLSDATQIKLDIEFIKNEIDKESTLITVCKNGINSYKEDLQKCVDSLQFYNDLLYRNKSDMEEMLANFTKEFRENLTNLESEQRDISNELKRIASIKDICPTCGQHLVGVKKPNPKPLQDKYEELQYQIGTCRDNIDAQERVHKKVLEEKNKEVQNKIDELLSKKQQYEAIISDNTKKRESYLSEFYSNQSKISVLQEKLNTLEATKENLQNQIIMLNKSIEETQSKILYNINERDNYSQRIDIDKKMMSLVTRDFRGHLLLGVIDFLNSKAKQYCKDVFNTELLRFELSGNNIDIYYGDKVYEVLSGGEKQKVDIVVQFTLRSMLCDLINFSSNIIVLDEIFDNLDDIGCQNIINLITRRLNDISSIYIVTHHSDISIPYDKIIEVEKDEKGLSKLK